jgi:hypothetical protein
MTLDPIDHYQLPREAVQAAVKLLWDKRSMLPENSEEIVEDVLCAAIPHLGAGKAKASLSEFLESVKLVRETESASVNAEWVEVCITNVLRYLDTVS